MEKDVCLRNWLQPYMRSDYVAESFERVDRKKGVRMGNLKCLDVALKYGDWETEK